MATKAMYQKVNEDEESAENLLENKSSVHSPPQAQYQRIIQNLDPRHWNIAAHPRTTIVTVLLCLSIILNLFAWSRISSSEDPMQEVEYGEDFRYMSLDHHYDHLWNRIGSDRGGLIKYADPSDPPTGGDPPIGIMSMFHQLHCVASLRNALQSAYYGMGVAFDQTENRHWPHCLDYLRKSILCSADDTIEREKVINGTRTFKIDGIQDTRQCRDTTHLYDMLKAHGFPDSKGPLGDLDDNRESNWWIDS